VIDKPIAVQLHGYRCLERICMSDFDPDELAKLTLVSDAVRKQLEIDFNQRLITATGLARLAGVDFSTLKDETAYEWASPYAVDITLRDVKAILGHELGADEMSTVQLASVRATFDYSQDTNFTIPNGYKPNEMYRAVDAVKPFGRTDVEKKAQKSFKDVICKSWGKVVIDPDPSKNGGYCFPSNTWLDHNNKIDVTTFNDHPAAAGTLGVDDYDWMEAFPGLVKSVKSTFSADSSHEVLLVSLSYAYQTIVLVLINRQVEARFAGSGSEMFSPFSEFDICVPIVHVPFPFNQVGDYNTVFGCYNTASINLHIEVNENFGLAMIGQQNFKTGVGTMTLLPQGGTHLLDCAIVAKSNQRVNVFQQTAEILAVARGAGLLEMKTGSVGNLPKLAEGDDRFIVQAMTSEVKGKKSDYTQLITTVRQAKFNAPEGLSQLPIPPDDYTWIGDVYGFVYLLNTKTMKVSMPFEVFELPEMYADWQSRKSKTAASTMRLAQDIRSVQALLKHQRELMKGLQAHIQFNLLTDMEIDDLDNATDEG
jgi:hypothetical protein